MNCRKTENEVFETMAGNLEIVQGCGLPIELSYNQVYYFSMHFYISTFLHFFLSTFLHQCRLCSYVSFV